MMHDEVTVWAPASLSNLGPGFDCLGVAITEFGDYIQARRQERSALTWEWDSRSSWSAPVRSEDNTAFVAARSMLERLGSDAGVHLLIRKMGRAGSGLGSSAASAVGAAFAVAALHSRESETDVIREAALDGEQTTSGARHGDNVLPSLHGGFVLAQSDRPEHARRVDCPVPLHLAVVIPAIDVLTREARELLPEHVTLAAAVRHASLLGLMIHAIRSGNIEELGALVMSDELIEPRRAALVAPYEAIRSAARKSGALGVALSGSGPALFAVCPTPSSCVDVAAAMRAACADHGVGSLAKATAVDPIGVRIAEATPFTR